MQSRLYSPGYAGVGRWVLFHAEQRRAFAAAGREVVPDVVRVLVRASAGATYDNLTSVAEGVDEEQLAGLTRAGLLQPAREAEAPHASFVSLYQRATYDYPFFDYSLPGARAAEDQLLDRYTRLWPAPPSVIERPGEFQPLPKRALAVGPPDGRSGVLNANGLGWVLQHSFGPTGEIKTRHAACIQRTSPSGGARHPAEAAVELPAPLDGIAAGFYLYDVARHGLVYAGAASVSSPLAGPRFIVRARVERPMWRYRELRALRPVLLDVGHVVETLALLLDRLGLPSTLTSPRIPLSDLSAILDEPPVAALDLGHPPVYVPSDEPAQQTSGAQSLLTNPFAVLRFVGGRLVGETMWPVRRRVPLDESDFLVLNHCLPSSRGDRSTEVAGILAAVPGTSGRRMHDLVNSDLLMPSALAERCYRAAGLWTRHDWYLSLLAHAECLSDARNAPARSGLGGDALRGCTLNALAERRTVRAFKQEPISASTLSSVLSQALGAMDDVRCAKWARAFVATLGVENFAPELSEWSRATLKPLGKPVTREQICAVTTGQKAVSDGSCTIWLVAGVDVATPAAYELGFVELGRIGQRICLAATSHGLGAFMTPAVKDSDTLRLLGLEPDAATVAYAFGIGVPRSTR